MVTASLSSYTYLDGFEGDRSIPFGSNSLQHGTAVFDGIRCYSTPRGPALFRPREHVERLLHSARTLGIEHDYSFDALLAAVVRAAADSKLADCYVRPVLFARDPYLGVGLRAFRFTLGVEVWPVRPSGNAAARLTISPWRRPATSSFPPTVKATGTYAVSALAKTAAVAAGFDDAIQLDALSGRIAEATIANVFVIKDGRLSTPWTRDALLPGITRDSVLRLAALIGLEASEGSVEVADLAAADEVCLTGTASGLVTVSSIGQWRYTAHGPVFAALSRAYQDAAEGRRFTELGWCHLVPGAVRSPDPGWGSPRAPRSGPGGRLRPG
jgi:branched-chain amino acid aminotransferase